MSDCQLNQHILRIANLDTVDFYQRCFGMQVIKQMTDAVGGQRIWLGFPAQPTTVLELRWSARHQILSEADGAVRTNGYWKIGITDADIDQLTTLLEQQNISVSKPAQFLDIGYLCHLRDPDGYHIELLQHQFKPALEQRDPAAGRRLGQITLRCKNPQISVDFYQQIFGMRLLSEQRVEPYGFTLYFLACTDEQPPQPDVTAVGNREWLWQRPYTTLELQHFWGTEEAPFDYQKYHDREHGFWGLGISTRSLDDWLQQTQQHKLSLLRNPYIDAGLEQKSLWVCDPDGYRIRVAERLTDRVVG